MVGAATLHPDFESARGMMARRDDLVVSDLPDERKKIEGFRHAPSDQLQHREHAVPVSGGTTVRVIESRPLEDVAGLAAIVWVHGGGYVLGTPEMDQTRIDGWAESLGCAVFAPDYRLAPDSAYPAAFLDCWGAIEWIVANADSLGIDPAKLAVAGVSAGGGLAAALALRARDAGVALLGQVLFCPMVDDRFRDLGSSTLGVPGWSAHANEVGWTSYLGPRGWSVDHSYAVPARVENLAGLAPAFVAVGGLDVLRDEGVHYAVRLMDAGVPVDLHLYDGAPHGFNSIAPAAAISLRLEAETSAFLSRRLSASEHV